MSEKSRATLGGIWNPRVITGKATAPPPSLVAPAMKEPNAMVTLMNQFSTNRPKRSPCSIRASHPVQITATVTPMDVLADREPFVDILRWGSGRRSPPG